MNEVLLELGVNAAWVIAGVLATLFLESLFGENRRLVRATAIIAMVVVAGWIYWKKAEIERQSNDDWQKKFDMSIKSSEASIRRASQVELNSTRARLKSYIASQCGPKKLKPDIEREEGKASSLEGAD